MRGRVYSDGAASDCWRQVEQSFSHENRQIEVGPIEDEAVPADPANVIEQRQQFADVPDVAFDGRHHLVHDRRGQRVHPAPQLVEHAKRDGDRGGEFMGRHRQRQVCHSRSLPRLITGWAGRSGASCKQSSRA